MADLIEKNELSFSELKRLVVKHLSPEEIYALAKQGWDAQARDATMEFRVGDKVTFEARGRQFSGTVLWVNEKSCKVDVGTGRVGAWRVQSSLLRKVA